MGDDTLVVQGNRSGAPPPGGGRTVAIATHLDHRIAMSLPGAGPGLAPSRSQVDDGAIDTSFPGF
jgi:5-enolpyruvylshikimate-3-phosphate synthase